VHLLSGLPAAKPLFCKGLFSYLQGDVLRELASTHPENPLPRLLLEHRKLSTLLVRYLIAFLQCLRHAEPQCFPGGLVLRRIRGSFNQTCTETGGWVAGRTGRAWEGGTGTRLLVVPVSGTVGRWRVPYIYGYRQPGCCTSVVPIGDPCRPPI
jgi:hypothetical protein